MTTLSGFRVSSSSAVEEQPLRVARRDKVWMGANAVVTLLCAAVWLTDSPIAALAGCVALLIPVLWGIEWLVGRIERHRAELDAEPGEGYFTCTSCQVRDRWGYELWHEHAPYCRTCFSGLREQNDASRSQSFPVVPEASSKEVA